MNHYRLGLDIGTNSVGWSVLELDGNGEPCTVVDANARIFSDGRVKKSKATLAADRRAARSERRLRDRFKQRQAFLMEALTEAGLFPADKEEREALRALNPLELRARLLTEQPGEILQDIIRQSGETQKDKVGKILRKAVIENHPEYLIGRALFHLNQRRGFQSNRKDKGEEAGSDGKISRSARLLLEKMELLETREEYFLSKEELNKLPKEEKKRVQEEKKQANKAEYEARKKAFEDLKSIKNLTYGSFLYARHKNKQSTRVRPTGTKKDDLYLFYPIREMYEDEFNKIWNAQAAHYPNLMTDEQKKRIRYVIFTQRPLRPQKRGKCTYLPKEDRTFRAMPSFQRYRIYQDVNNLEWNNGEGKFKNASSGELIDVRNALIKLMEGPKTKKGNVAWRTIENTIKKYKLVAGNITFNFMRDDKRENGLDGNLTSNVMQHEDYVGPDWHQWDLDKQDKFIDVILNGTPEQQKRDAEEEKARKKGKTQKKTITDGSQDDKEIVKYLMQHFGLQEQAAEKCVNAPLQDGTANVSLEAAKLMLKKMRDGIAEIDQETGEVRTVLPIQPDAAEACAKEVSGFVNPMRRPETGDGSFQPIEKLPYYGEVFQDGRHIIPGDRLPEDRHDERKFFGGVTNPTVHIALNQIRQVVNELISRFGHPASIAIELGRDLPEGEEGRNKIKQEQKINQDKNEQIDGQLREHGQKINFDNRLRMELWEKQNKLCPYTLDRIGLSELFTFSIDIDHILPFSRSLDDSRANKVVCKQKANQDKGNKTPWEAFHNHPDYDWQAIRENAVARYYHGKDKQWKKNTKPVISLWRFQENAFKIWEGDNEAVKEIARKMAKDDSPVIKGIAEIILEKGVGALSDKQKKIAEEKYGLPYTQFSPRHLNDTRYIGRLAREYLECICHIDKIDVLTGRLTALLRGHWGLNSVLRDDTKSQDDQGPKKKNRDDHRHHAVDAIVVGMTSKSILQKVATAAEKVEGQKLRHLFPKNEKGHSAIDPDWADASGRKINFRDAVKDSVSNIVVSHKAKRKKLRPGITTDGQLHNETALGLVKPINKNKNEYVTVVRRPIDYLKERKHVEAIRNPKLRAEFLRAFDDAIENGIKGNEGIQKLAREKGIRRLRCFGPTQAIPIEDKNGKVYKGYQGDSNWGMEIYTFPEGHKKADKWEGVVISRFDANKPDFRPGTTYRPEPTARLVMRLQINDCIEIERAGKKQVMYLAKSNQKGKLFFAEHNEANLRTRNDDKDDAFEYFLKSANALKSLNARKVHISPTGQVNYEKRRKPHRKKK